MPKPNYAFAKRQRDIAKKQKQDEKRQRKAEARRQRTAGDEEPGKSPQSEEPAAT